MEQNHEKKVFKYFTANSTRKYIDILDEFVNRYNTVHSFIKMTPTEASKKKTKTKSGEMCTVITVLSSERRRSFQSMITSESLKKGIFDKGYTPNWTEEIFTVSEVRYTDPITYKLKDLNGKG